jgi:O-antigen/teichoic acid export membrane protein
LKQHIENASWGGFAAALRSGYGLLNVLLTIRLLGAEDYGQIATLLAFFTFYGSLSASIFTMLVVKLLGPASGSRASGEYFSASVLWVFCSVSILILVALVAKIWPSRDQMLSNLIPLMCLLVATQIVSYLHIAILEASGRFDVAVKTQLFGPLIVSMILCACLFIGTKLSTSYYVAVLCSGSIVDLALAWFFRRRFKQIDLHNFWRPVIWQQLWILLKSGSQLQLASLMNMLLDPLNKALLNSVAGGAAVAVYDLAMKVIWGIQSLFSSAMRVFLHIASQDQKQIESSYLAVIRLICVPSVLLHVMGCLFVVLAGKYWVFLDVETLVVFFALATISNLGMISVAPLYNGIIGTKDVGFIFKVQARLALINVVSSCCLVPFLGVIGAAFGLLLATICNVLIILKKGKTLTCNEHLIGDIISNMPSGVLRAVLLFFAAVCTSLNVYMFLPFALAIFICCIFLFCRESVFKYILAEYKRRSL